MNINSRELCPHCIDFIPVIEEKRVVRDDEIYQVESIVRYCQSCNHELARTVNLRFKHKMG